MPSGPKKRKKVAAAAAAKRKEEDEVGISTTTLQQVEEIGEMGSSENDKDVSIEVVHPKEEEPSVSERSHEILLEKVDGSEGAEAMGGPTEILLEKVSEERVDQEAKEEVGEGFVTERSAEIVLQEVQSGEESVAHVTEEEVVEASEVLVSVPSDSALSEGECEGEGEGEGEESREMPHMGTVIMSSASAFPVPAALSEQRASLWSCCGLLDAFKGSQR